MVYEFSIVVFSGACSLDFNKFPYEAHSECLGVANVKDSAMQSCCHSALQSLFQAMAIRANKSGSIFLELNEAQDCTKTFQNLHNRTNLSTCELQDFISSSKTPNLCSKDVDSLINLLGVERFGALQSNCNNLSTSNYNDDACYSCFMSFRSSLQALKQSGDSPNGENCGEALLLSLSSTATDSANSIPRIFSCLWDEIGKISQCFSTIYMEDFLYIYNSHFPPCYYISESSWPKNTSKRGELSYFQFYITQIFCPSLIMQFIWPIWLMNFKKGISWNQRNSFLR